MKKKIIKILNNKFYQLIFAIILSLLIVFLAYHYKIEGIIKNNNMLEKKISSKDIAVHKRGIKDLKEEKAKVQKDYKKYQEDFDKKTGSISKESYYVMMEILTQINKHSFNIINYSLNDKYNKMDIIVEGSYQNFINFLDYLGNIKAIIKIPEYDIKLTNAKRLRMTLSVEVEAIQI